MIDFVDAKPLNNLDIIDVDSISGARSHCAHPRAADAKTLTNLALATTTTRQSRRARRDQNTSAALQAIETINLHQGQHSNVACCPPSSMLMAAFEHALGIKLL